MRMRGSLSERFEAQYIPEPNSGCWIWIGAVKSQALPYGKLRYSNSNKRALAHRISFEIANGIKLRRADFVCHRCDNPSCVNPDHLFLGDKYLNMEDRDRKSRQRRGVTHGNAILTDEKIKQIRKAEGSINLIGKQFNTHPSNISLIKRRLAWKHVP